MKIVILTSNLLCKIPGSRPSDFSTTADDGRDATLLSKCSCSNIIGKLTCSHVLNSHWLYRCEPFKARKEINLDLIMAVKTNRYLDGNLPEELTKVLQSLAISWGDVFDISTLNVTQLSGAMTNEVYRVTWPTNIENVPRNMLVRVYGEGVELFFDRDDEIRTFECLSEHGCGPKLLGKFKEGRVEEFIHARTLSAADLRIPENALLIAAKMREFHDLDMPGPKTAILWDRLRNWLVEAKNMCSADHAKEFRFDELENEISLLMKAFSDDQQEIGFCHNDLQYGNIMIKDKLKSITLIDYEYASYNPVAYDLANHFCEMAANYHTDTPHVLDYNKYPGIEERERFIRQYIISAGRDPNDIAIKQLADDVEKYTLANHIFWGLWGLISGYVNHIEFDYIEYARQRFEQYWMKKLQILNNLKPDYPNGFANIQSDVTIID